VESVDTESIETEFGRHIVGHQIFQERVGW
jgi:hypothetical protein